MKNKDSSHYPIDPRQIPYLSHPDGDEAISSPDNNMSSHDIRKIERYIERIKLSHPSLRYHVKEFISFETGRSLKTVEAWIAGRKKMSAHDCSAIERLIDKGVGK